MWIYRSISFPFSVSHSLLLFRLSLLVLVFSHFRSYVPQPNCFNIRRDIISELYKRIRYVSIHTHNTQTHTQCVYIGVLRGFSSKRKQQQECEHQQHCHRHILRLIVIQRQRHRSSKGKSKYTMMMTVAMVVVAVATTTMNARQKWLHYIREKRRKKNWRISASAGVGWKEKQMYKHRMPYQNIHLSTYRTVDTDRSKHTHI